MLEPDEEGEEKAQQNEEEEEEEEVDNAEQAERNREEEEKKKEDALWARFLRDVGEKPKAGAAPQGMPAEKVTGGWAFTGERGKGWRLASTQLWSWLGLNVRQNWGEAGFPAAPAALWAWNSAVGQTVSRWCLWAGAAAVGAACPRLRVSHGGLFPAWSWILLVTPEQHREPQSEPVLVGTALPQGSGLSWCSKKKNHQRETLCACVLRGDLC